MINTEVMILKHSSQLLSYRAQIGAAVLLASLYALGFLGFALLVGTGGSGAMGPGAFLLLAIGWGNVLAKPLIFITGVFGLATLFMSRENPSPTVNLKALGILAAINVLATMQSAIEIISIAPALIRHYS